MQTAPALEGALPLLGQLVRMRRDPLGMLVDASRLGPVVRLDLGPRGEGFVATHPEAVQRIFLDHYTNYTKQTRGFDTLRPFVGQGLLTSEGEFWKRQRRIAQPAFHQRSLNRFADSMVQAAEELTQRWERFAERGETFDVADEMMRLTLRIVGECLFSTDPSTDSSRIGPAVDMLLRRFIPRITAPVALPLHWPLPGNRAVRRAIAELHQITDALIAERLGDSKRGDGDLLDMLISARDEETGEGMSPTQLRHEVLTLLVAGHETTAAALSWAFTLLAQHPQIDAALEQELVALGDRPLTLDQLNQLTLTGQVLQETLRLYPPAWIIARAAAEDDRVCDVTIPGGSLVITSPYATQRLPEFFSQPERFDPQRFRADAGMNGGHSRYAYFPFGAGPRICIGNGFAWLETRLVLATLRRRFRLRVVAEAPIRPLPQLTLRCRGGVPVRAELVT